MDVHRALTGGLAALVLLAACSSPDSSGEGGSVTEERSSTASSAPPSENEPLSSASGLDSICDLVSTEDVESITGLAVELREQALSAEPPHGRCSWEPPNDTVVLAAITARSLLNEGVGSPDEWWSRNLPLLEDAVISVEPLPAFGEHGYLAKDDDHVEVLWFPGPDTYVEARLYARGTPPPSSAELERMVIELSELFAERLEPYLPS